MLSPVLKGLPGLPFPALQPAARAFKAPKDPKALLAPPDLKVLKAFPAQRVQPGRKAWLVPTAPQAHRATQALPVLALLDR